MTVYVIPIPAGAGTRYELYCLADGETDAGEEEAPREPAGVVARFKQRFATVIRDAEQRQAGPAADAPTGRVARVQERMLGWIAERIGEQRLLWNLRSETAVELVHADDLTGEQATAIVQRNLKGDYERHRNWLAIDAVGLVVSGLLALIPGPNLVAYYFIFRVGGHWLSMRGAMRGLSTIGWTSSPSPLLTEMRRVVEADPRALDPKLVELADGLGLPDLPAFIARVAARGR